LEWLSQVRHGLGDRRIVEVTVRVVLDHNAFLWKKLDDAQRIGGLADKHSWLFDVSVFIHHLQSGFADRVDVSEAVAEIPADGRLFTRIRASLSQRYGRSVLIGSAHRDERNAARARGDKLTDQICHGYLLCFEC